jgi:hypothetical protein
MANQAMTAAIGSMAPIGPVGVTDQKRRYGEGE